MPNFDPRRAHVSLGAELALSRGGLSRRDVGIAVVVAGLGALTLAFT